ncbi:hypothetical protein BT69DRAFT_266901 [Atractiella rhizophila]|nr:hypothetical protein BT69DRAFT_266901 [Atractiella rhizophila]
MERGVRSTRPRQTTLTEKEDASIADLLPSESAPENGIARQRMHAMCSGGQERASKGEREASKARFLVPSPCTLITALTPASLTQHKTPLPSQCSESPSVMGLGNERAVRGKCGMQKGDRTAPSSTSFTTCSDLSSFHASRTPAPLAPTSLFRATLAIRLPLLLQQLLCTPQRTARESWTSDRESRGRR